MQSPAFRLAWRHLQLDPALRERADGDIEGIRSNPSKEETPPLRGGWGQDDFHDSPFDSGTKVVFGESLLLTMLLAT